MGTLYLHIDQEVGRMGPKMLMMMLVWSCAVLCGSARRRTPADPCIQSCKRPIIRVPTCGSDGRNYSSLCDACRHGTEARCVGRCPCDARCKRKCSLFPRRPTPAGSPTSASPSAWGRGSFAGQAATVLGGPNEEGICLFFNGPVFHIVQTI